MGDGASAVPRERPLAGRRVLVTRSRAQAEALAAPLRLRGATVVRFPATRIAAPRDPSALRAAAAQAGAFDWIVFTSPNAVERFWGAMGPEGMGGARICAVGPSTAAALRYRGVRVELTPPRFEAQALAGSLTSTGEVRGRRVLLPRAEEGRRVVADALRAAGAEVVEVDAYRTVPDGAGAAAVRGMLLGGSLDVVTFAAGSAVRAFVSLVGTCGGARVATIGPATSAVARSLGLGVDVEAAEHTVSGLVQAVVDLYSR